MTSEEQSNTHGGNYILRGVAYVASILANGWEAYEKNDCNGGCEEVGMSGGAGLGNTPYSF